MIQFPCNELKDSQMVVCGSNMSQNVKRFLYLAEIVFYYGSVWLYLDCFKSVWNLCTLNSLSQVCHQMVNGNPHPLLLLSFTAKHWNLGQCITIVRRNW